MIKKVMHICISDSDGGAEIATKRLHSLMNKSGLFNSKMFVLKKRTKDKNIHTVSFLEQQIARLSARIERIFLRGIKKEYGWFSLSIMGSFFKIRKEIRAADIIYLHWINGGFLGLKEIESILKLKKPVIFFCHDMWHFTGGCHYSNGCDKFRRACESCHFFSRRSYIDFASLVYLKKKHLYQKYAANISFIGPSPLWKEKIISSKLMNKSAVHYIPNLIDEDKFTVKLNSKKNRNQKTYKILFGAIGGKTNPLKGWSFFVEALQYLPLNIQEQLEIILFGYDYTEQEILPPYNVVSLGRIMEEQKIIDMYQSVDVFVFPSLMESFGQTLLEAMACGIPSVAFPVGITVNLIEHKYNGYIADYKNSKDLAAGIEYLLTNPAYELFARRARDTVEQAFSSKLTLSKHFNLLENLLSHAT